MLLVRRDVVRTPGETSSSRSKSRNSNLLGAMAASADPLLRNFGAVDRREAFTDTYGEQRCQPSGRAVARTKRKTGALPWARVISDLSQNGLSQNGYGRARIAESKIDLFA